MQWSMVGLSRARLAAGLAGVALALAGSCGVRRPDDRMIAADYLGRVMSRNVARGRNRYEVVCVPCHGDHDERQGPLLASLHWTPPEIRHQVREGNSLMPAIPRNRLSDEDLEHLLAFFQTTGACVPDEDGLEEVAGRAETAAEAHAGTEVDNADVEAEADAEVETDAARDVDAGAGADARADVDVGLASDAGVPLDAGPNASRTDAAR